MSLSVSVVFFLQYFFSGVHTNFTLFWRSRVHSSSLLVSCLFSYLHLHFVVSLSHLFYILPTYWMTLLSQCSKLVGIHSKKDWSCFGGKRWSNIILIKVYGSVQPLYALNVFTVNLMMMMIILSLLLLLLLLLFWLFGLGCINS
jgi:hypothetical protein